MINEKTIEEAALAKYNDGISSQDAIKAGAFEAGAHWAIDEFLKWLWHPVSEEPKEKNGKCLILRNDGLVVTYSISCVKHMIFHFGGERAGWKSWCYLDDILPKKGGSDEGV